MGLSDRSTKFGAFLSITGFVAALATSREARSQSTDDTTQSCVEPHQSAQQHRNAGDLLRSRDDLRRCSATTCPALIQNDCTTWLAQVVDAIPSVVFVAKLDDDGVFDVAVSVDGKPVTPQLDGKPVELNPGLHTFVFERHGFPPIEKKSIVTPRERGQLVSVSWKSPSVTPLPIATIVPTSEAHKGASAGRVVGWSALGLAVAGIAVGSVAGVMTFSARSSAQTACPNNRCMAGGLDDIDHARTDATVSTVGFTVGAAAAALGAYLVLRPEHEARSALQWMTVGPMVSLHEGGAWIGGRFE
jgi:hypothetical protein